jgi:hypothetical protein
MIINVLEDESEKSFKFVVFLTIIDGVKTELNQTEDMFNNCTMFRVMIMFVESCMAQVYSDNLILGIILPMAKRSAFSGNTSEHPFLFDPSHDIFILVHTI